MNSPQQGGGDADGADAQRHQDNNALVPEPLPVQLEAEMPGPEEQAGPANDNGQFQQNVAGGHARVIPNLQVLLARYHRNNNALARAPPIPPIPVRIEADGADAPRHQDNNALVPEPLPVQLEAEMPGPEEQAGPANDNGQDQENVAGGHARVIPNLQVLLARYHRNNNALARAPPIPPIPVRIEADGADAPRHQDNNALVPEPLPVQLEAEMPGPEEQAGPANDNGQDQENVAGGQARVIPDLRQLEALYVNPPLPMLDLDEEDEVLPPIPPLIVPREQIDREFRNACDGLDVVELGPVNAPALDMPVIEVPQDEAPVEQHRVAVPVEQPRVPGPVKQPEAADDMYDSIEEELSSMSSATSSTVTSTTETSDEDNFPLIPFYNPGPGNGPRVPMIYVPGRYPPGVRPVEPAARPDGQPQPSRPILIPPPNRPGPPNDDDDSSSPDMAPTRSKRRRPDRPH